MNETADVRAPSTLQELLESMCSTVEQGFFSMDGPPQAYFDLPLQSGGVEHCVYRTFRYWMKGTKEQCESALVAKLDQVLSEVRSQVIAGDPLIIWRKRPELKELPEQAADPDFALRAMPQRCELYTRLYVPGVDLKPYATPEGEPAIECSR
jgi:hypothetical protein